MFAAHWIDAERSDGTVIRWGTRNFDEHDRVFHRHCTGGAREFVQRTATRSLPVAAGPDFVRDGGGEPGVAETGEPPGVGRLARKVERPPVHPADHVRRDLEP